MIPSTLTLWTGPFPVKGCLGLLLPCFIEITVFNANRVDPDQTPRSAASDLGLHCLPMSILCDASLTWLKASGWNILRKCGKRRHCFADRKWHIYILLFCRNITMIVTFLKTTSTKGRVLCSKLYFAQRIFFTNNHHQLSWAWWIGFKAAGDTG